MTAETSLTYGIDEIEQVVELLYGYIERCKVFTFEGSLGAGKTTLIRAFLKKCGITQEITSPTFAYLNLYENQREDIFYHFDLYRITSMQEFIASGFDEYLYQPHSWAIIEWPEIIMPLLEKAVCKVTLNYKGIDKRQLKVVVL